MTCATREYDLTDNHLQNLISKLKFISKIEKGEKIDLRSLYILSDNFPNRVYRTLTRSGSRLRTLELFRSITDLALNYISACFHSTDVYYQRIGTLVISSLRESMIGIRNSGITYENDRMFVAQIETLLHILNTRIQEFEKS